MDDDREDVPLSPELPPSPGWGPTYILVRDWLFGVSGAHAWRA